MIIEHGTMPVVMANDYKCIDQKLTVFIRGIWDSEIIPLRQRVEENKIKPPSGSVGFTKLEWALRAAAWSACREYTPSNEFGSCPARGFYSFGGEKIPEKLTFKDLKEASLTVKNAARFLGASLVGIAEYDPKWVYSSWYDFSLKESVPAEFSFQVKSVIAIGVEVDYSVCLTSPSLIACAATGQGYSRMGQIGMKLATFIRMLGYNAIPSGNDTALSIPIAVQAGLGELGRNGILITPQYGPRVRLLKIFTDMPLQADKPITFGVSQFCVKCKKCAQFCPAGAIPIDAKPTMKGTTVSNSPGVLKWYINPESCYQFWALNGGECNNCVACCPYNKWSSWHHGLTQKLTESIGGKRLLGIKTENDNKSSGESEYNAVDYALCKASWEINDQATDSQSESSDQSLFDWGIEPNKSKTEFRDTEEASLKIKKAAKFFGADLVGLADYDENLALSSPDDMQRNERTPLKFLFEPRTVIVMAVEMDNEALRAGTSLLTKSAAGIGYSRMIEIAKNVATFIRQLGYWAVPCVNDTARSVPLAVKAGLGEDSGNGLLITKEFGPRVQLFKVFTGLRLEPDKPIDFGVREFCTSCQICAEICPAQASFLAEENTVERINNISEDKWHFYMEKCLRNWDDSSVACYKCIISCPYSEPKSCDDLTRIIANTPLASAFNKQDSAVVCSDTSNENAIKAWWKDG